MNKINLSWILITLMISAFLIGYGKMNSDGTSFLNFGSQKAEETVQKAIDFVSENMLDGAEAVLVSVSEESGVYKFKMKIDADEFDSYLTKDGKILFPSGISLVEPEESAAATEGEKMTCDDINKTKEPILEAFVVSKCPFGVQMQKLLKIFLKQLLILKLNIWVQLKKVRLQQCMVMKRRKKICVRFVYGKSSQIIFGHTLIAILKKEILILVYKQRRLMLAS